MHGPRHTSLVLCVTSLTPRLIHGFLSPQAFACCVEDGQAKILHSKTKKPPSGSPTAVHLLTKESSQFFGFFGW